MVLIPLFATALFLMAKSGHTHQAKLASILYTYIYIIKLYILDIYNTNKSTDMKWNEGVIIAVVIAI